MCKSTSEAAERAGEDSTLSRCEWIPFVFDVQHVRVQIFVTGDGSEKHAKLPTTCVRSIYLDDMYMILQLLHDVDLVLESDLC
jgi:hypothetical protein